MHVKLGDVIHYLRENRPHSADVLTIVTVENAHDDWSGDRAVDFGADHVQIPVKIEHVSGTPSRRGHVRAWHPFDGSPMHVDDWSSTEEQVRLFQPFGPSGRVYCTVHGMVEAKDVLEVVPAVGFTLLNAAEQRQLAATERMVQALVAKQDIPVFPVIPEGERPQTTWGKTGGDDAVCNATLGDGSTNLMMGFEQDENDQHFAFIEDYSTGPCEVWVDTEMGQT